MQTIIKQRMSQWHPIGYWERMGMVGFFRRTKYSYRTRPIDFVLRLARVQSLHVGITDVELELKLQGTRCN